MVNDRIVVTVDGLAASGKTALAKGLADRLGFGHLNSGLFYRATALIAHEHGAEVDLAQGVSQLLRVHRFELMKKLDGEIDFLVDGVSRIHELSSEQISRGASRVAQHAEVRELLLESQKNAFPGYGLVAEGRDMGTIVFPGAPVKFFVEARLDVRTKRRAAQLVQRGEVVDLEAIQRELQERDQRDAQRAVAPMKPAEGAVLIDNSEEPLEMIIERMYQAVLTAGLQPRG
jgi:cytidylate kinase